MRCSLRLLGSTVLAALLGTLLPAGETAGARESTLEGSNVTRYEYEEPLSEAESFLVRGERTADGGCRFTGEETISLQDDQDHLRFRTRELAYDPTSCLSLMETGTPISESSSLSNSPDRMGTVYDSGDGVVDIQTHAAYLSSMRQWYEEPAQQSVGEVTNAARWRPDNTCASPTTGQDFVSWRLDWLEQTGWRLIDENWTTEFSCRRVLSEHFVHYRNSIFCATIDTDVFFDVNRVEGLPGEDGVTQYTFSFRKSGGCNFLLRYHRDTDLSRVG